MSGTRLVSLLEFSRLVCAKGHIAQEPNGGKCHERVNGLTCGAKMGKSRATVGSMCRQGRIPGAVKPAGEWLIDLGKATARQKMIRWLPRGRPKVEK